MLPGIENYPSNGSILLWQIRFVKLKQSFLGVGAFEVQFCVSRCFLQADSEESKSTVWTASLLKNRLAVPDPPLDQRKTMFANYNERARRVIFFAHYEACQLGSPYIETEHLLMGLLREDKALTNRFLRSRASVESIRKQIEGHTIARQNVSTSVEVPLSNESRRVLAYSAEEAERLFDKHIGTEHLLLGLLREEKCFAAQILQERGVELSPAREALHRVSHDSVVQERAEETSLLLQFITNLGDGADQLQPLVGRESELEQVIHILSRVTRRNPVLVGEPGVGKNAIVDGLAQRIASGSVPAILVEKSILALDLSPLAGVERNLPWLETFQNALSSAAEEGAIFLGDELHAPVSIRLGKQPLSVGELLTPLLVSGKIQCISTATPPEYAKSLEHHRWLEQYFEPIQVVPASEADAIKVMLGTKGEYEKFHGVTYTEDALKFAVYYSSSCIMDRHLPGKAVDLMDEAGACVKLRKATLSDEVTEVQKRIQFIVHRMENAIANHEFEKARFYSDEERKEREKLRRLQGKYKLDETVVGRVSREDIESVVARWTGRSVASIRQTRAEGDGDAEGS
jgi:ATP-dependent Clp protease ATP-binding subunit ClpC